MAAEILRLRRLNERLGKMGDALGSELEEYEGVHDELKAECDRHGKRGEETFVAFVRRLAGERVPEPEAKVVTDEPLAGTGDGVKLGGFCPPKGDERPIWPDWEGRREQPPSDRLVLAEQQISLAHAELMKIGAPPGLHRIGTGPAKTFTVAERIEWVAGHMHEQMDKVGVAREEFGTVGGLDGVRGSYSRLLALHERVSNLCQMLVESRQRRAEEQERSMAEAASGSGQDFARLLKSHQNLEGGAKILAQRLADARKALGHVVSIMERTAVATKAVIGDGK